MWDYSCPKGVVFGSPVTELQTRNTYRSGFHVGHGVGGDKRVLNSANINIQNSVSAVNSFEYAISGTNQKDICLENQ